MNSTFLVQITASASQLLLANPIGGGAIFILGAKIGLKSTKNVVFCILFRPMGRATAPLATLLLTNKLPARKSMEELFQNGDYLKKSYSPRIRICNLFIAGPVLCTSQVLQVQILYENNFFRLRVLK